MINNPFALFPKERITLPEAYREIYTKHYIRNRSGSTNATSLSKKLESWMHKKVAADVLESGDFQCKSTLEIGAGTLNHIQYEQSAEYDIVEPFKELFQDSENIRYVRNVYSDIKQINLSTGYDRVISIATFEHITDLPTVVALSCLLLKENGQLRFAIPNEGTWLWKLAYQLTTGVEFRLLYGLNYAVLMNYEHVNTASEIEEIVRYFYQDFKREVFGLHKNTAFYRYYTCKNPQKEKARAYLKITDNL